MALHTPKCSRTRNQKECEHVHECILVMIIKHRPWDRTDGHFIMSYFTYDIFMFWNADIVFQLEGNCMSMVARLESVWMQNCIKLYGFRCISELIRFFWFRHVKNENFPFKKTLKVLFVLSRMFKMHLSLVKFKCLFWLRHEQCLIVNLWNSTHTQQQTNHKKITQSQVWT